MWEFCFKNRNGKERPGFPCFKAFWGLGRWRQVCVTGREDSCIHCTLVWGELPSAGICHRQPLYRIPVRRGWGAFRKRHIKHALCTSGHKSPWKHVCTLFYVLLLLRIEKKLQAWFVSQTFRIKMRNYDPVWQGLSDSRMSIKASSQTQYVPGSRARFLKLSKALSLSDRHNQPSSLSRGRSTYNLENTKQGIASQMVWKKAVSLKVTQCTVHCLGIIFIPLSYIPSMGSLCRYFDLKYN